MSLTAKDVTEIMSLLEASAFDELSLEVDGLKLHLRRSGAGPLPPARAAVAPAAAAPAIAAPHPAPAKPPEPAPAATAVDGQVVDVPAPLLGVYYRAPKPGEPPFVEVGDQVEPDTVIGIIEVMKLMNSVRAGVSGTIVAIPAENGVLVEYGQCLIQVRPAS